MGFFNEILKPFKAVARVAKAIAPIALPILAPVFAPAAIPGWTAAMLGGGVGSLVGGGDRRKHLLSVLSAGVGYSLGSGAKSGLEGFFGKSIGSSLSYLPALGAGAGVYMATNAYNRALKGRHGMVGGGFGSVPGMMTYQAMQASAQRKTGLVAQSHGFTVTPGGGLVLGEYARGGRRSQSAGSTSSLIMRRWGRR